MPYQVVNSSATQNTRTEAKTRRKRDRSERAEQRRTIAASLGTDILRIYESSQELLLEVSAPRQMVGVV